MAARGTILTVDQPITFHVEACANCGVLFAFPTELYGQLQKKAEEGSFYCPNGHAQHYVGKSDARKAKDANEARREAEVRFAAERDQRLAAERELKRHQQRAKGGACPCCNRTFVQLARHMKTKHPGFTA